MGIFLPRPLELTLLFPLQNKDWELAGSKLGDIMGVPGKKAGEEAEEDEDDRDGDEFKADQKFADHLKVGACCPVSLSCLSV